MSNFKAANWIDYTLLNFETYFLDLCALIDREMALKEIGQIWQHFRHRHLFFSFSVDKYTHSHGAAAGTKSTRTQCDS